MSRYATIKKFDVTKAQVNAVFRWHFEGSALKGTYRSEPRAFDLELTIDSSESPEKVAEMIRVAHNSCYTEQALENPVKVNKTHFLNGEPLDVPDH